METYISIGLDSFRGYWNYLLHEIQHPDLTNYFYWLLALSVVVWLLELVLPWRKQQGAFRRDFWLDAGYMFFNFFVFSLVGYAAISNVAVEVFNDGLAQLGITNIVAIEVDTWPIWAQLLLMFLVVDFVHWNVHRLLHRVPWLWEFHKLHHSVKEMGFAAHLRFHWMESVVYKTIQYIPLAMIGFGIQDFFVVHMFGVLVGHLNHANVGWDYGPLRYVLNNPKMHIWHHAKELPNSHRFGVNYGLTLSIWDYVFKTAYVPYEGRDIELGFDDDDEYPSTFVKQITYPLSMSKKDE